MSQQLLSDRPSLSGRPEGPPGAGQEELAANADQLRVLSRACVRAREEEARRIAHQLHDELGQLSASMHLFLGEIGREISTRGRARLDELHRLLECFEDRLRRISHELRPTVLDDLGLWPALESLACSFRERTGVPVRLEGMLPGRLDPRIETAVYRVVQEALSNVARHARAKSASVRLELERQGALRCRIRDDGVGFDPWQLGRQTSVDGGLGLIGMRERLDALGGTLRIRSAAGCGTELDIRIPRGGGSENAPDPAGR